MAEAMPETSKTPELPDEVPPFDPSDPVDPWSLPDDGSIEQALRSRISVGVSVFDGDLDEEAKVALRELMRNAHDQAVADIKARVIAYVESVRAAGGL